MLSYERFGRLRLHQFVVGAKIAQLANWEFMDHIWVGEAVGFSEWLRFASDPEVLRSLALDFSEFPAVAASAVLRAIELPIQPGMRVSELRSILGNPIETQRFVADRLSYEFVVPGPPKYLVSCTVLVRGGLSYLVVMRPLRKRWA
jgi:hypothetical protein